MKYEQKSLCCRDIIGAGPAETLARARRFLHGRATAELLQAVGQTFDDLALKARVADKRHFPVSYGGGEPCDDDLLTGLGAFYTTQSGKLMLDCVSGHYQMTWGYNHPDLTAAAIEAMRMGVVWDNHSNTPSLPVKMLADALVELAGGRDTGLERVLLGVATGSVACGAALKIMLVRYFRDSARSKLGPPVVVALSGNYHGTDIVAQAMRGMWKGLLRNLKTVQLEPNDAQALQDAFRQYGARVAGFWAEPVMMNREAILVDSDYLHLARRLCTETGALMVLDEIQTGFWYPEVFLFRRLGLRPDLVIVGKGMTAGFHPLAGVIYPEELDILEQYDAISTNGNASLASLVGLCNLSLIERERGRMAEVSERHEAGLRDLAAEFPGALLEVKGLGFLTGLKCRSRRVALGFHKAAVERGLWLRLHAYHPGHRTILMKCPLVFDEQTVDFVLEVFRELLLDKPWE